MNNLHTTLVELQYQIDRRFPTRSAQWQKGLAVSSIQDIIWKVTQGDFPYAVPDGVKTLLSWSNGYYFYNFCGMFFEGLHEYSVAVPKYEVPKEGWKVLNTSYFVTLSLFSTGESGSYIVPLSIDETKDVPVIHVDYENDRFEVVFSSLENMFKVILECEMKDISAPSPYSTNIESVLIAANVESQFWKKRLEYIRRKAR